MTPLTPQQSGEAATGIADSDLLRARESLKQHALTLAKQWQSLSAEGWNPAHGRGIQLAARQIVKASERLRLSLSRKASELESALRVFVETSESPEVEQIEHLSGLISMLASTALAVDLAPLHAAEVAQPAPVEPTPASPTSRVDGRLVVLGMDEEQSAELLEALREHRIDLRVADSPLDIGSGGEWPAAILFDGCMIEAAASMARYWADQADPSLAPKLGLISSRRDLGRKLVASQLQIPYFEPPLDVQRLIEALGLVSSTGSAAGRVLLLDANRERAVQQAHWLTEIACTVRLAIDATDLATAMADFRPDLVIIDGDLPENLGLACVQAVREWPQGAHLPIVVAGDSRNLRQREDAIAAGADEYLIKPVKPRHLSSVVVSRLHRARRWASLARPEAAAASAFLPRNAFLDRLRRLQPRREAAAIYVALDDAEQLRKQLGLARLPELDQVVGDLLISRLGAADFAGLYQDFAYLLLVEREERHELMAIAEALRTSIESSQAVLGGQRINLHGSLGVALLSAGPVETCVDNARAAALAAQQLGGNRCLWFDVGSSAIKPAEREARAGALLARPQERPATLLGQPLLPLRGQVSEQYLITPCWPSEQPDQAPLTYADISRLGNDSSRLQALDRRLLAQALDLRADQLKRGKQLRLVMELSPGHLQQASFLPWLAGELKQRKLSGSGLAVVLPSSLLVDHLDQLVTTADAMHRLGLRIGLGDFGRDLAAVARLKLAPIDLVVLAPEAIHSSKGPVEESTLASLVRRAQDGNAQVVARDIERKEALALVERLGVEYVLSTAVAAPSTEFQFEFKSWLRQR